MSESQRYRWVPFWSASVYHARRDDGCAEGNGLCRKVPLLTGGVLEPDLSHASKCGACLAVIERLRAAGADRATGEVGGEG